MFTCFVKCSSVINLDSFWKQPFLIDHLLRKVHHDIGFWGLSYNFFYSIVCFVASVT